MDVEEIKEELEDSWHKKREEYEARVKKTLDGNVNACQLFLEIDGFRSVNEIEDSLNSREKRIPHATLWRAARLMARNGLIRKVGIKGRSPIYSKKPWVKALAIDDYVRHEILGEDQKP